MTKVEQLKARAYTIDIIEEKIKNLKDTKEYMRTENPEEMNEWQIKQLTEADDKIKWLEYIEEELAK